MKLRTVLFRANKILGYPQRRKKAKLYRQWVERAGLPPEAVPEEEFGEDIIPQISKEQLHLPMLYMLLGAALLILCMGLVLLIVHSC